MLARLVGLAWGAPVTFDHHPSITTPLRLPGTAARQHQQLAKCAAALTSCATLNHHLSRRQTPHQTPQAVPAAHSGSPCRLLRAQDLSHQRHQ